MGDEKRATIRKTEPAEDSKAMDGVEPMKGKPDRGQPYDPGFTPPPEGDPWIDTGEPETNG